MKSYIIPDEDGQGITRIYEGGDFEYVNPEEFHKNAYVKMRIRDELDDYGMRKLILPPQQLKRLHIEAKEEWDEMLTDYLSVVIPHNLLHLLISRKKSEQIKLLKNLTLNTKLWFAFQVTAWKTFGYTFSCYNFAGLPKGINENDLPLLIVDGDELKTVGKTSMSEGQLRNVIAHRNVIVAYLLDNGDTWHAFFCTYKSMRGEEKGNSGNPHWHYISDKWGISRKEFIRTLKEGRHPSSEVHIAFID